MEIENLNQDLIKLLEKYKEGLYSEGEVNSICMEFLMNGDDYLITWQQLPAWIQKDIVDRVGRFGEFDEVVLFGQGDPNLIKSKILALKSWLQSRDEM